MDLHVILCPIQAICIRCEDIRIFKMNHGLLNDQLDKTSTCLARNYGFQINVAELTQHIKLKNKPSLLCENSIWHMLYKPDINRQK